MAKWNISEDDMDLPKVGSKWVCMVDKPRGADIYKGEVVTVTKVGLIVRYERDSQWETWACLPDHWADCFEPYAEDEADTSTMETPAQEQDMVNSPSHYGQGSIEAIDYIQDFLTKEEYQGYLRGNIAKYLHRWPYKNGAEDLQKAAWYLDRLIKENE